MRAASGSTPSTSRAERVARPTCALESTSRSSRRHAARFLRRRARDIHARGHGHEAALDDRPPRTRRERGLHVPRGPPARLPRARRDVAPAHVLPWVPLGIVSYLCGHIVRGLRCRLLVRREASLRARHRVEHRRRRLRREQRLPRAPRRARSRRDARGAHRHPGRAVADDHVHRARARRARDPPPPRARNVARRVPGLDARPRSRRAPRRSAARCRDARRRVSRPGLIVLARRASAASSARSGTIASCRLATSITNAGACLRDPRDAARILLLSRRRVGARGGDLRRAPPGVRACRSRSRRARSR